MKKLLGIFKSRYFLLGIGLLLGVGLVLVLGAWMAWPLTVQLGAIIALLVLFIVLIALSLVRANRSAAQIEWSIQQQAEQQLMNTRPDKREEVKALQEQLERAIQTLKQSKLGRGRRGKAALYALPWYLFIGPSGAGKTTAIAHSGLNFPLGSDRIRGVGGTRNCDWFFSDAAILLDTAGRYMTEAEDAEEWLAFLDTLKKHRSAQPINGVIVGIALSELSVATPYEIEEYADNIRRRIDELVEHLGVRFPVYLAFTKCDLVQGFVEFFGELSRREREQIWGCTLEEEQQPSSDPRAAFEEEFDLLCRALLNRRSARLRGPMKREERRRVYAFPLQFASMKEQLARFVDRLFQSNPYRENPVFRGFYFTSGTQEGVPLDRVIETLARRFNLPPAEQYDAAPETETKSYFIKKLFTEVIIPDQYMVRSTSKARRRGSLQRVGVAAAAVVLLGLFLLGTSQALVREKLTLNRTRDQAVAAGVVRWDNPRLVSEHLAGMDRLYGQIDRLEQGSLLSLGLDRSGRVLQPTRRLYLHNARGLVESYPLSRMERRLRATSLSLDGAAWEERYGDLKAYLLLTTETDRLEADAQRTFLTRYLTERTTDALAPSTGAATRGQLRAQLEPHLAAFVEALHASEIPAFGADVPLIERLRRALHASSMEGVEGLYQRLRLQAKGRLEPFTLENAVPGYALSLFTTGPEVPGFFTKTGWNVFVKGAIEQASEDPNRDDWVLGPRQTSAQLPDPEQVAAQLKDRYFSEYAAAWERFVQGIRIRSFGGVRRAAQALGELGSPYESPLVYLLAHVTEQTRFQNALLEGAKQQATQGVVRSLQRKARSLTGAGTVNTREQAPDLHPVDRRFQWLHRLKADRAQSGQAASELYKSIESLQALSITLEGIAGDPNEAAAFAAGVLKEGGGALDAKLRAVRGYLRGFDREVLRHLFEAPIVAAWGTVVRAAQQALNARWRTEVYEPFQAFSGQYPFDPTGTLGAPAQDVAQYFNPQGGVVTTFLSEALAPYLGPDLRPQTWEGRGIELSSAAQRAIARAQAIGTTLFAGGVMRVSFDLQPELPLRSENAPVVDQVCFGLVGREECYRLGFRPTWHFEWPGPPGGRVVVSTQEGTLPPKRFEGTWALFRMLEAARVTPQAGAKYGLQWTFQPSGQYEVTARFYLSTQSASNPFRDPRSFFNYRPPASLN